VSAFMVMKGQGEDEGGELIVLQACRAALSLPNRHRDACLNATCIRLVGIGRPTREDDIFRRLGPCQVREINDSDRSLTS
jgi:hypothetical protein